MLPPDWGAQGWSHNGASPGMAADCTVERYGADVAEVMKALALSPAVLVGHSMGCRVVIEAALQAPAHAAGIVLIDGSQFASAMEMTLRETFATPGGYSTLHPPLVRGDVHREE